MGTKVAIVSDKPQTTRTQVRGVLTRDDAQVVFVDTPGIHKPRTTAGARMNATASGVLGDVDVVCLVIDATAPLGPGDRFVAERVPKGSFCIVNKVDVASREQVLTQLTAASALEFDEYFPVSARTGEGVDVLVDAVIARLPEGPAYYPDEIVTDVPEAFWVAELVREQLLAIVRDELPHSIACRVTEWEWPRVRCEILVERDSQKGIVIGHQGSVLKAVGTAVRQQMEPGAHLELAVRVDKDWQRHAKALDRLGY
jgi:GTP-binding protein Era